MIQLYIIYTMKANIVIARETFDRSHRKRKRSKAHEINSEEKDAYIRVYFFSRSI